MLCVIVNGENAAYLYKIILMFTRALCIQSRLFVQLENGIVFSIVSGVCGEHI